MRFKEYMSGDSAFDRSLERFHPLLSQLKSATEEISNPDAKEEISNAVETFANHMKEMLGKHGGSGPNDKHLKPGMSVYAPLMAKDIH